MESVQPRADAATRYGPLTATTAVQSVGNARREAAAQPGNAANPSSDAGETTATFSRRAQELSARQTQEVRQAQDTQDQDRMTARQASDAVQTRQVAETDAAAEANRRATAQSTAPEVAGALGAQARRAYQGVDSMSAAG